MTWAAEINECVAALVRAKKFAAAAVLARRTLAVEPDEPMLWTNYGAALLGLRDYRGALDATTQALGRGGTRALVVGNLGLVHEGMGHLGQALAAFGEADVPENPDRMSVRWNRCLALLRRGDYEGGFADFDARINETYNPLPAPRWGGERGRRVYVEVEQGIGDKIMYSRFLPWLAGVSERVYLRACALTRPLFTEMPVELVDGPPDGVDHAMYMASLPRRYGLRHDAVPEDPGHIRRAVERSPDLDLPQPGVPGIKVGICWACNPAGERPAERSVPLAELMALGGSPRVWLYSLQAGDAARDVAALGAGNFVMDLSDRLHGGGFLATGRAILNCDVIVTCDTSVAHLAGALRVPVWLMVPEEPTWPWAGETTPWYPTMRLFHQERMMEWGPVIRRVAEELAKL